MYLRTYVSYHTEDYYFQDSLRYEISFTKLIAIEQDYCYGNYVILATLEDAYQPKRVKLILEG